MLDMNDLLPGARNFYVYEAACKCGCGFGREIGDVQLEIIMLLEAIREDVGGPVRLTSWCRCQHHNQNEGGVENSVHCLGEAADIQVEGGRHRYVVQKAAHNHGAEGVGTARGFIHVDVHKGSVKPRPSALCY